MTETKAYMVEIERKSKRGTLFFNHAGTALEAASQLRERGYKVTFNSHNGVRIEKTVGDALHTAQLLTC